MTSVRIRVTNWLYSGDSLYVFENDMSPKPDNQSLHESEHLFDCYLYFKLYVTTHISMLLYMLL
jgi:hypothetical protein